MRYLCFLSVVLFTSSLAAPAIASDYTTRNVLVTTQYAVPVGVPVAPYAPTYYSLQATGNSSSTMQLSKKQEEQLVSKIAERVTQQLTAHQSTTQQKLQASAKTDLAKSVLQQRCVNCHSPANAKGGLNLDLSISKLPRQSRQKAILRMISSDPSRRMPKGQPPLSEEEFLALFHAMVQ